MSSLPAEPLLTISDLETLKVISDPLRLKIYQTVSDFNQNGQLCSVKEIADTLQTPQSRLYYHIKQLENSGLLLVGETRLVSGIVEKRYRVQAYRLIVSENLFSAAGGKEAFLPMLSEMINEVLLEMQAILQSPKTEEEKKQFAVSRHTVRIPVEKAKEFTKKFESLLKEIEVQENEENETTKRYTFFSVFYPQPGSKKDSQDLDSH